MPARRDIDDFLAQKRIAVVGVSRDPKQFANLVYSALKTRGYHLYPVNPQADQLEGDRCYSSVGELPERVDGVLVMLPAQLSEGVVRQCADAGIRRVWLGKGAVAPQAVALGRERGLTVVEGACPMMFAEPVGFGHACHRFVLQITGSLPK